MGSLETFCCGCVVCNNAAAACCGADEPDVQSLETELAALSERDLSWTRHPSQLAPQRLATGQKEVVLLLESATKGEALAFQVRSMQLFTSGMEGGARGGPSVRCRLGADRALLRPPCLPTPLPLPGPPAPHPTHELKIVVLVTTVLLEAYLIALLVLKLQGSTASSVVSQQHTWGLVEVALIGVCVLALIYCGLQLFARVRWIRRDGKRSWCVPALPRGGAGSLQASRHAVPATQLHPCHPQPFPRLTFPGAQEPAEVAANHGCRHAAGPAGGELGVWGGEVAAPDWWHPCRGRGAAGWGVSFDFVNDEGSKGHMCRRVGARTGPGTGSGGIMPHIHFPLQHPTQSIPPSDACRACSSS